MGHDDNAGLAPLSPRPLCNANQNLRQRCLFCRRHEGLLETGNDAPRIMKTDIEPNRPVVDAEAREDVRSTPDQSLKDIPFVSRAEFDRLSARETLLGQYNLNWLNPRAALTCFAHSEASCFGDVAHGPLQASEKGKPAFQHRKMPVMTTDSFNKI
jgi:hypothetical protein